MLLLSGCFGLDHIQVFQVSMVNDTGQEVIVRDCASFCSSSLLTFDMPPGDSVQINRAPNQHKYFSVVTSSGQQLGCVDLFFKTPAQGSSVPLSQAGRCPGSAPPWRIIGLVGGAFVVAGLPVLLMLARSRRPKSGAPS